MDINAYDLDWKSILIKKYRNYDLDEIDCMVLFVSDAVLHVEPKTLITKEILSPYMVDGERIDDSLSRLMEKQFLSIKNEGNAFFTSLDEFKKKLFDDAIKDMVLKSQSNTLNARRSDSLYQEIESIANRSLTPLERDQVTSWIKSGASDGMIKEACERSLTKAGNISFKTADRLILDMQRSQSRKTVGASMVNEDTKQREELREFLLNTDWTYHGKK